MRCGNITIMNIRIFMNSIKCCFALSFCLAALFSTAQESGQPDKAGGTSLHDVRIPKTEQGIAQHGKADNVLDLQSTSIWHTQWQDAAPQHPHQLVIDLGSVQTIGGLKYLPRQDSPNGRIKDFRVFVSNAIFTGL